MRISDWSSDVCSSDLTHPVYSLSITGSSNAHELLSASTDGRLCQWNLSLLDEPTVSTQLRAESKHLDGELDAVVKPVFVTRSEERRVGKGGVRTCSSRWSPYH